ncbi:MAG: hypothetical protein RXO24_00855 [Acidilobus sp.]
MPKVRRSTLIVAAVVLFFFIALTAVAYVNSLRQARVTPIFNAAVKYILGPHDIAVSNFTVTSFSRIACMGTANGSVQFFLMSPAQYQNVERNRTISSAIYVTPSGNYINVTNVYVEPGTYYVIIYNPSNQTTSLVFSGYCEVIPYGG